MDVEKVAEGLTQIERDWFTHKGWGSWVHMVGCDLAQKGLTRRQEDGIVLTPLGLAVRAHLTQHGRPE